MAPQCQCNPPVEAVQRTVKKEGPNTGRQFWTCGNGRKCRFFQWDTSGAGPINSTGNVHTAPSSNSHWKQDSHGANAVSGYYRNSGPNSNRGRGASMRGGRGRGRGRSDSAAQSRISFMGASGNGNSNHPHGTGSNTHNAFARNSQVRSIDGSAPPRHTKRSRVECVDITGDSGNGGNERLSSLTFQLESGGFVSCEVSAMWNKSVIETLQSIKDVDVSDCAVLGMKTVMVPLKQIKAARTLLEEQRKMRMEFSFPFQIVERLQLLTAAHAARIREGDEVTQSLEDILPVGMYSALMDFQEQGIKFALERGGRVLIGDDMGLGKTLQAIAVARVYVQDWPLLIICPSSLRLNWKEEILRWLEDDVTEDDILVIMTGKDGERPFRKINIVSYDLIRKVRLSKLERCKFIIADESHYLKSSTAQRTKFVTPLVKKAKRALLLSGTPALSRPVELFTQANALVPLMFPNYTEYVERYCNAHHGRFGYDVSGSSNLEELHTILRASILIRRKKDDVLTQLPAKRRQVVWVEAEKSSLSKIKKLFGELNKLKAMSSNCSPEDAVKVRSMEQATKTELYVNSGIAKVKSVLEFVKDTAATGVKFIIFAHHQKVMDGIAEYLSGKLKLGFIRIDGETKQSIRQSMCKSFQEKEKIRVALLSITAAGVGLTLTAATVVLFAELYWNPGSLIQAEDRAHRIGQRDCVVVKYLLAKGTYDESIWSTVRRKFNVIGKSLTGAAATIDVVSQTPEKPENPEEIKDDDEVTCVTQTSNLESQTTQKSTIRKIDLTQDDDDNPVCIVPDSSPDVKSQARTDSAKKSQGPSTNWDEMFPRADAVINLDKADSSPEVELVDPDVQYAKDLKKELDAYFG